MIISVKENAQICKAIRTFEIVTVSELGKKTNNISLSTELVNEIEKQGIDVNTFIKSNYGG